SFFVSDYGTGIMEHAVSNRLQLGTKRSTASQDCFPHAVFLCRIMEPGLWNMRSANACSWARNAQLQAKIASRMQFFYSEEIGKVKFKIISAIKYNCRNWLKYWHG
ncbi:hypothetical protein, partial [Mogibacterium sp.]|uniref:hypothetical protein n=1 Tax=Mogibacterium sp. TaxID=2049035 RepID=UPI0025EF7CDD